MSVPGRRLLQQLIGESPRGGRAGLRLRVVQGSAPTAPYSPGRRRSGAGHPGHQRLPRPRATGGWPRCPTGERPRRSQAATRAARPRCSSRSAGTQPRRRSSPSSYEDQPAEHHRPDHQGRPLPSRPGRARSSPRPAPRWPSTAARTSGRSSRPAASSSTPASSGARIMSTTFTQMEDGFGKIDERFRVARPGADVDAVPDRQHDEVARASRVTSG